MKNYIFLLLILSTSLLGIPNNGLRQRRKPTHAFRCIACTTPQENKKGELLKQFQFNEKTQKSCMSEDCLAATVASLPFCCIGIIGLIVSQLTPPQ